MGQGKDDVIVNDGQQLLFSVEQPLFPGSGLAFRTMAILAGVIAILHFITILTIVNVLAQNLGPALFNSPHSLSVSKRHPIAEFIAILGSVAAEDLRQLRHCSAAVS